MTGDLSDLQHLANTADAMGRACQGWQESTARYHFAVRDMIRAQAGEIARLRKMLTDHGTAPKRRPTMQALMKNTSKETQAPAWMKNAKERGQAIREEYKKEQEARKTGLALNSRRHPQRTAGHG